MTIVDIVSLVYIAGNCIVATQGCECKECKGWRVIAVLAAAACGFVLGLK